MEVKLTLKLDKSIIQSAKAYAEKHNRSLSRIVEDYFKIITSDAKPKRHYSPLVEELSGVISEQDLANLDYVTYLEGKYE
jgi:replicative DNA helicase